MATVHTVDKTYFVGDLTVAQAEQTDVSANIDRFVLLYKEEFLRLLLGDDLYTSFVAGVSANDPAMLALNNKLNDTTNKISPIANYVYFFIQRDGATQTTASGEKIMKPEGAVPVGNAVKAKLAWNRMVNMNRGIVNWMKNNGTYTYSYVDPVRKFYPEFDRLLYYQRMGLLKTIVPFF